MRIDCNTCPARGHHCAECIVATLAQMPVMPPEGSPQLTVSHEEPLDDMERCAVDLFAGLGMITPREALRARAWCDPSASGPGVPTARFVG